MEFSLTGQEKCDLLTQVPTLKLTCSCFSAKLTALRSISKDWLDRNETNVSEWVDMSIPQIVISCINDFIMTHIYVLTTP
jgi:hypothetical protein